MAIAGTTKITLVIAEAAIETVPEKIARHPSVVNHARNIGVKPAETLLDRSYHHAAMRGLDESWKRGRPDLVHFSMLEALSTPLFMKGLLNVYVHTFGNKVIDIAGQLRIPKSYFRFECLMMKLFAQGKVTSQDTTLLSMRDCSLEQLFKEIGPAKIVGLSTSGVLTDADQVVKKNQDVDCVYVVGGFPKGHFSENTARMFNCTYSIHDMGLESHVVIARILYECEKAYTGGFR
ncbi:MAG: ribosome biogenesis protein [Nitrososphaera sp.]|nr:ribosome biogenesis protein [Nitrososphaera sp.]